MSQWSEPVVFAGEHGNATCVAHVDGQAFADATHGDMIDQVLVLDHNGDADAPIALAQSFIGNPLETWREWSRRNFDKRT